MNNEFVERPPLGIEPEYIWVEDRLKRLESAIERYKYQGKQVPEHWYEEQVKHVKWLENYCKSKEQLKPKEWEIVQFKFSELTYLLHQNKYYNEFNGKFNEVPFSAEIKSVRRLSDNSIWSVGERVLSDRDEELVIKAFEVLDIWEGGIKVVYGNNYGIAFARIKKAKQPLFTTEDGKEIFEGDRVWHVNKMLSIDFHDFDIDLRHYPESYKYFSTEAAANEYVLMNKPCLSINDVLGIITVHGGIFLQNTKPRLLELAKERLSKT